MQMEDITLLYESKNVAGEKVHIGAYGPHFLMDCHGCDPSTFNRTSISKFAKILCRAIDMDDEDFHFWDDEGIPEEELRTEAHVKGTSLVGVMKKKIGVQFIITSSIVIHTLDILERVYVDIFSCKLFDEGKACMVTQEWFKAHSVRTHLIQRT